MTKDFKRVPLAAALGLGKKAKEMGNAPVSEVFAGLTSGALGVMGEMEKPAGLVGGMDGPEM